MHVIDAEESLNECELTMQTTITMREFICLGKYHKIPGFTPKSRYLSREECDDRKGE